MTIANDTLAFVVPDMSETGGFMCMRCWSPNLIVETMVLPHRVVTNIVCMDCDNYQQWITQDDTDNS